MPSSELHVPDLDAVERSDEEQQDNSKTVINDLHCCFNPLENWRKTANHELNEQVFEWFCNARSKNIPITGKLIQEKAVMLSVELGLDDFSASNGWLDRFQKRRNISCSVLSGEGASVNEETVNDWCSHLESICEGYSLKDIFNADETGLFYRALPTRSQVIRGDKCHGSKNSKERITVLLGCSATGEKLTPLVIGRAANPRCFRGYSTSSLPVTYQANKRAWMTSTIFKDWLQKLNNKMTLEKRKIIMFVDNCAAMTLSNVKLVFLPPNTTARLQPCVGGINKAVKSTYRKKTSSPHPP
ncbi:tigger transposable element-derived protein 6-like [Limulus polyphemus]|uniref:Tigger transposable element-derived protein 6-like n=1 Tax=Limulus polyphemus TaxID=6850 RepID=A0ABM1B3T3_LIMPO|nr:tigger transposable element-derived protein 6-like [Limulus polyphemus]